MLTYYNELNKIQDHDTLVQQTFVLLLYNKIKDVERLKWEGREYQILNCYDDCTSNYRKLCLAKRLKYPFSILF